MQSSRRGMVSPSREAMARIVYFVHGRGRGHASRARAVVPGLRRFHDMHVFGGGQAPSILGSMAEFAPVEACVPGTGLASSFARRLRADLARLRELRPALVITDGDAPSLHAARLLRIPSLALGHGLVFAHCVCPPGLPRRGIVRETLNSASSSWLADHVIPVHFAPAPIRSTRATLARPDLRDGLAHSTRDEGYLLAYFRDDDGYALLDRLSARGHRIRCFTRGAVPSGVEREEPHATRFADALARCSGVVSTAGNHLPAECAMVGKKLLAVYAPRDLEQQMNAHWLEQEGLGVASRADGVGDDTLDRFDALASPSRAIGDRVRALPPASMVVHEQVSRLLSSTAADTSSRA